MQTVPATSLSKSEAFFIFCLTLLGFSMSIKPDTPYKINHE